MIARLTKALKTEENDANDEEEYDENDEKPIEDSSVGGIDGEGGGDIDMNDIVIIDEYDSRKPDIRKTKNVSFFLFKFNFSMYST